MNEVVKSVLDSGVRVVTEHVPGANSVTIGFWVGVGSRDEPDRLAGASHFCEHLLFKGTAGRSARSIAVAVDAVGGEMNAFTAREHTAFYVRLPTAHMAFGIELLANVVSTPAFRRDEFEAEREVIIEEILMSSDMPDDVATTALWAALFPNHPLGRDILGSRMVIETVGRDEVVLFHHNWYTPSNLVVAVAGDLDHEVVVNLVGDLFAGVEPGISPPRLAPAADIVEKTVIARSGEQVHLAFGWRGLSDDDDDRYALLAVNNVLGGGMSSRLFHEVREKRGLAYTVYSSPSRYRDCGAMSVYVGTAPEHTDEVQSVVDAVIEELVSHGPSADEHSVALGYLEGSLLLGLEDTASRMARIGASEVQRGRVTPLDEHVERIRAVTIDDMRRVLSRVFDAPRAMVMVGPFGSDAQVMPADPDLAGL